jgi:carbonic anhydrase
MLTNTIMPFLANTSVSHTCSTKINFSLHIIGFALLVASCHSNESENIKQSGIAFPVPQIEKVTTAAEQQALSPDTILQRLKAGNKRFTENNITARDHSKMVRATAGGQYPKSVVLSCLDSRIPVEDVFDKGIGDMFVARNAGNIVNEDVLGSMEFGCKISGAKLILVMGHSSCGAIKSAIDDVRLGNITAMLAKIKPAVALSQHFAGAKTSKNEDFTDLVGKNNVLNSIQNIRMRSPILKEMEDKGIIKMVGAYYDIQTGKVEFIE